MDNNYPHEIEMIINRVLEVGAAKYPPGYWRGVKRATHMHHFYTHMDMWEEGIDNGEDHLAHALLRLAMAVIIRDNENLKIPT